MFFVSLIPFFLVVRIDVDERTCHGAKYVFDVTMKSTWTPMNHEDAQSSNFTLASLICRTKEFDTLNCRLNNVKKKSIDTTNADEIDVPTNQLGVEFSEQPFDIKFTDRGIDYLIVDEEISVRQLNLLKSIVELLAIGEDLNGVPDGSFQSAENSTIGNCNVTFSVGHKPSPRNSEKETYELVALPNLNKVPGETIQISKAKDLDDCSSYATFSYGRYGESTRLDNDLPSHIMSFVSHTLVSDTRFVSSATKKSSIGSYEDKNYIAVTELFTLTLKDVFPASGNAKDLPQVQRPSRTSIAFNSDLERVSR